MKPWQDFPAFLGIGREWRLQEGGYARSPINPFLLFLAVACRRNFLTFSGWALVAWITAHRVRRRPSSISRAIILKPLCCQCLFCLNFLALSRTNRWSAVSISAVKSFRHRHHRAASRWYSINHLPHFPVPDAKKLFFYYRLFAVLPGGDDRFLVISGAGVH